MRAKPISNSEFSVTESGSTTDCYVNSLQSGGWKFQICTMALKDQQVYDSLSGKEIAHRVGCMIGTGGLLVTD
jgi:hypothetical protein